MASRWGHNVQVATRSLFRATCSRLTNQNRQCINVVVSLAARGKVLAILFHNYYLVINLRD